MPMCCRHCAALHLRRHNCGKLQTWPFGLYTGASVQVRPRLVHEMSATAVEGDPCGLVLRLRTQARRSSTLLVEPKLDPKPYPNFCPQNIS